MKMVCGGYYDSGLGKIWALMNDSNTGNFRILGMIYEYKKAFATSINKEITRADAPKLFEAKTVKSASSSYCTGIAPWVFKTKGIENAFLYVVDNILYIYNIANDKEVKLVDGNVDVDGFYIDDVFVHNTFLFNASGENEEFVRLGLAIRDKEGTGKKGGVVYYKIVQTGGTHAVQYFKKTGFCDQVISFDEKIN